MKTKHVLCLAMCLGVASVVQAQDPFTDGLVAYYPFNGNANDQFGSGNAGILENGAFYTNGIGGEPNSAIYCNGANAYVLFGKNDVVYPNQVLTWSIWFKAEASQGILFWDDDDTPGGDRNISIGSNAELYGGSQEHYIPSGNSVVTLNQWQQAVFTSGTNGQYLYLDGILINSTNVVIENHAGRSSVSVGAGNYTYASPNFVYGSRFKGAISKVRIYNRALSASEVRQLFEYEAEPRVHLLKAVKPSFAYLRIGTNYQLQLSGDLNTWTNHGVPFTATNNYIIFPQYWDVDNWDKLFFRLQVSP
jgi:hypothetical protein